MNSLFELPGVLPGTTVELDLAAEHAAKNMLDALFLPGGLVLSQVCSLTGLDAHMVQNWVKRGFLPPPVNKKYSKAQFCRIALINQLKDSMNLDKIAKLLQYVNGNLADARDDIIGDAQLYLYFASLAGRLPTIESFSKLDELIDSLLAEYVPQYDGAVIRIKNALRIIAAAYLSASFSREVNVLISKLDL